MRSVAEHVAVPPGGTQLGAQRVTLRAGVRADAGMHGAHFTDDALDDQVRFEACEDRRIFRLHFTIASDRLVPVGPPATSTPHGLTTSTFSAAACKTGSGKPRPCVHGTAFTTGISARVFCRPAHSSAERPVTMRT